MELRPHGLTALLKTTVFGVWLGWVGINHPTPFSALPLRVYNALALKLFRGEPAIAEFGWNFSPNHKSSPSVIRLVGSGLLRLLRRHRPAHG